MRHAAFIVSTIDIPRGTATTDRCRTDARDRNDRICKRSTVSTPRSSWLTSCSAATTTTTTLMKHTQRASSPDAGCRLLPYAALRGVRVLTRHSLIQPCPLQPLCGLGRPPRSSRRLAPPLLTASRTHLLRTRGRPGRWSRLLSTSD